MTHLKQNSVIYTGLDAEDLAMFNNHAGIGRVEVVIPKGKAVPYMFRRKLLKVAQQPAVRL